MTSFPILTHLGLVVVAGAALLILSRPFRLPPLLVYILAGLVLGPFSGLLGVGESLELFAELGIALLLFLVGLELSVERIREVGRTAAGVGILQVGLTTLLGAGLGLALGFSRGDALLLGLVTAFSSTVVVVKLLDRTGDMTTLHGRLAVGILLVQDVVVALVLTLLSGLSAEGGSADPRALTLGLTRAVGGIVVMSGVAWAGVRWVLPRLLAWLARSGEVLFVVALTWCFLLVILAEAFHVSIELGAFIAGVGLAQLSYGRELERRVRPLVDFFLAVFFVALGAGMEFGALPEIWFPALVLSSFVLVTKPLLVTLLLRRKVGVETGFRAGLILGQISEFAFVLMVLALEAGVVASPTLPATVTLVGLVTIAGSAVMVARGTRVPALPGIEARERELSEVTADPKAPPAGHVVVVGMNTLGRELVKRLAARGETVVAVDTDPAKLEGLPAETVFGSAENPVALVEAGAPGAALLVSALRIEDTNALLIYRCRRWGIPVSVHAFEPHLAEELLEMGADHVIVSKLDGAGVLEAEIRKRGGIA
jgi:Kef-type K+ transport system membrane component KefB